jgi:hypothetical protein
MKKTKGNTRKIILKGKQTCYPPPKKKQTKQNKTKSEKMKKTIIMKKNYT